MRSALRHEPKINRFITLVALIIFLSLLSMSGCQVDGIIPPNEDPISSDQSPSWSRSGQWICYTHISIDPNDTTYPTGLYIIDTNGKNRRSVIKGPAYNPEWSPDDGNIAFQRGEIFIITPLGDSLEQIKILEVLFSLRGHQMAPKSHSVIRVRLELVYG